jgi:hypothetical protein
LAYGASKLGDLIKGKPEGGAGGEVPADMQQGLAADQAFQDRILNKYPSSEGFSLVADADGKGLQVLDAAGKRVWQGDIPLKGMDVKTFADLSNAGKMVNPGISSGSISSDVAAGVSDKVASTGSDLSNRILDQSLENPAGRFAARQAVADALKSGDIGSSQAKELIKQIGSAATNPEAAEQAITQALQNAGSSAASNAASSAADVSNLAGKALRQEVEAIALKAAKDAIAGGIDPSSVNTIAGTVQGSIDQFGSAAGGKLSQMSIDGIARKAAMVAGRAAEAAAESITRSGKHLSEGQVYLVFNRICATNDRLLAEGVLREGPMDFFKGAAAKAWTN